MNARDYPVRARAGICVYGLLGSYELLTLDLQPSACCDALGAVHHGPVSVLFDMRSFQQTSCISIAFSFEGKLD